MKKIMLTLIVAFGLSACGEKTVQTSAAPSAAVMPADPALADLYASTCMSCHANGIGNAPLAGDVNAWAPRLAKGMETLLDHTIGGFRGMPPLGSCSDCSEDDFRELISFMASKPTSKAL